MQWQKEGDDNTSQVLCLKSVFVRRHVGTGNVLMQSHASSSHVIWVGLFLFVLLAYVFL